MVITVQKLLIINCITLYFVQRTRSRPPLTHTKVFFVFVIILHFEFFNFISFLDELSEFAKCLTGSFIGSVHFVTSHPVTLLPNQASLSRLLHNAACTRAVVLDTLLPYQFNEFYSVSSQLISMPPVSLIL